MMKLEKTSPFYSLLALGASVPIGTRGLVHVWGRNDMATTQQMGISWTVRDPTGAIKEQYADWEMWPYTGPGVEHEFIGGRFDINRPGNWTISVDLHMNSDAPVVVDSYDGLLCVVEEVVEEFAGTITKKELEYDETRGNIPVY